jgi:transglutaminase-like putative cysteine protease
MVLSGALLTAWASGDLALPAILAMLGLVGLHGRFVWDIRQRRLITPLLLLVLAALFAVQCRYTHVRADEAAAFAWETIARYFLSSMVLVLFLRPAGRLPGSLGLFHLATVMAAGQALLLDDLYLTFRLAELLGVTLAVLYAALPRMADSGCRQQSGSQGFDKSYEFYIALPLVLLILALNLGWIGGSLLYRHVETANFLPGWFWRGAITLEGTTDSVAQVGFSTSGRLSSILEIKEDQDLRPVLTISCAGSPGYLRARAFDTYRRSEWRALLDRGAIAPEQGIGLRYLAGRARLFRLNDLEATGSMIIHHESPISDTIFAPLGVCSVQAPLDLLMHDTDDILYPPAYSRSVAGYRITYVTAAAARPPRSDKVLRLLGLPPQLDPRIPKLAEEIFAGCTTTAEKVNAVVHYFRTHYTYALGLEVPPGRDALTYFLLEASTGYCEYFASGAAILLRLAGVPTRYVAGFLVTQQDERGDAWIARNADAHAWVEAWDAERREWTLVEATVQENLGAGASEDPARKAGGSSLALRQFLQALYDYGLLGILGWLLESYSLLTGISLALAFLGGALALVLLRRCQKARSLARLAAAKGSQFVALHKMLAAMDRKVKALGLRRRPGETLHAFAARIAAWGLQRGGTLEPRSLAAWYLRYAELRYCRTIDPDRLAELERSQRQLRRTL